MFKPAMKSTLIAASLALGAFSLSAQAALTAYTAAGGVDVVYSSVSNVTWTKDANLFKTMYDADNTLISKIAAVTPSYNDSYFGLQTISDGSVNSIDFDDFNTSNGRVTWWGALAFVNYLNHINYAGSNNWYLPTVANAVGGDNPPTNGTAKGDELVELYYQELGSKAYPATGYGIKDPSNTFTNEQSLAYWSGTEYTLGEDWGFSEVWSLTTDRGNQNFFLKINPFYAWAVSPGQVAAVPEPDSLAMFLIGLGVAAGVLRRRIVM